MAPIYQRILLKLSGEALEGHQAQGLCPQTTANVCQEIKEVCDLGVQVAVVVGGGNIFRGLAGAASGMNRSVADAMGMLATVINCLALSDTLERLGQKCRVLSAVPMGGFAELFTQRRALQCLQEGEVLLLGAGTGNPYFTTDTAAALRALEINANALLKATKVDGIYDKDPALYPDASRFEELSYREVIKRELRVMDLTAFTLCRENRLPIIVFNMNCAGNIQKVVLGEHIGSRVVEDISKR